MAILKIPNNFNNISLKGLTETELNIFFSILFKAHTSSSPIVTLSCNELKTLANGDCHSQRFIASIKSTFQKLMYLTREIETCDKRIVSSIFTDLIFDMENQNITIYLNTNFTCFYKPLKRNFTAFDLKDFISVRGTYAKNIFRLLHQFKSTNFFVINIEKFKKVLGIPQSYSMSKIDQRILSPVLKELSSFFKNLKIKKIRQGKSIKQLNFIWSSYFNFKPSETQNKANTPYFVKTTSDGKSELPKSKFEDNKRKIYPKLVKFISDIKKFENLHKILNSITTEGDLQNFKLKYNI